MPSASSASVWETVDAVWLLWVCHAPVGSRQARVNEVSPSVALGVQSRAALVPDAKALRVRVPAGGAVVVVGVVVVVVVVGVVVVVVVVGAVVVVVVVGAVVVVVVVTAPAPRFPDESNFETNTSRLPFEVRSVVPAPGSKSTVSLKPPVVYTLPDESTATEMP